MAKALLTPLKLGSITIRNRIGMAALTRNRADAISATPNALMKEYYMQRAVGGCGLMLAEGTLVTRQGSEWAQAPGIWSKEQIAAWKGIVDAVHTTETKMYCQASTQSTMARRLTRNELSSYGTWGAAATPTRQNKSAQAWSFTLLTVKTQPVYAPSAISARGGKFRFIPGSPGYVTPTAIEDPTLLISLFKQAAINAKEAGFDGVELHGANGYIVHEFLDSTSNKRTDKWGGSVENRARFGLEVLKALVEVFGPDVAVKLSPAGGYNDMGMPLEETIETYNYFISEADKLGLSYFCLLRYLPIHDMFFDGKGRATQHDVISTFRPVIKNAKVFGNGGFTPAEAEEMVSAGTLDGVMFGIPYIAHPDLAKRVLHGKPLDNVPDFHTFYGDPSIPAEKGFTDYPTASY
ncbi:Artemisinic aldehyde Delta(11(13)) reductase [Mycena sanguinolenta]|uniref:Artemisinic aldehyde Delta(11(13)) reductase n=1 Tax=Mycena sanguinolenta TaxID=230812 RepID=A0A8H7DAK6_9AGAR|nr:Artemisinic aldehyde Delta(11(13)) reductase [Mycena sanguinolenta]